MTADKKKCPKCNVPMIFHDSCEKFEYFIGANTIAVDCQVPNATCSRCGEKWEDESASAIRNDAFRLAIDRFWRNSIRGVINEDEIYLLRQMTVKVLGRVGSSGITAEQWGRWIADYTF